MDLFATVAVSLALLALATFAGWRGARPPDIKRGPRLMPWRAIMVTAAAFLLVDIVHLVNLLGVQTGR